MIMFCFDHLFMHLANIHLILFIYCVPGTIPGLMGKEFFSHSFYYFLMGRTVGPEVTYLIQDTEDLDTFLLVFNRTILKISKDNFKTKRNL